MVVCLSVWLLALCRFVSRIRYTMLDRIFPKNRDTAVVYLTVTMVYTNSHIVIIGMSCVELTCGFTY